MNSGTHKVLVPLMREGFLSGHKTFADTSSVRKKGVREPSFLSMRTREEADLLFRQVLSVRLVTDNPLTSVVSLASSETKVLPSVIETITINVIHQKVTRINTCHPHPDDSVGSPFSLLDKDSSVSSSLMNGGGNVTRFVFGTTRSRCIHSMRQFTRLWVVIKTQLKTCLGRQWLFFSHSSIGSLLVFRQQETQSLTGFCRQRNDPMTEVFI